MSVRRVVVLLRSLVQPAPVSDAPASEIGAVSVDGIRTVSPHDFARALTNSRAFFDG